MPVTEKRRRSAALLGQRNAEQPGGGDLRYVGFHIPASFVVGYGSMWAERYRNLPGVHLYRRLEGEER